MTDTARPWSKTWRRPMTARDPREVHRQASFLELFFDLCFVVAIAQAAAQLHHALAEDHIATGLLSYSMVFFAIWWAWMNFSWFASAYDNDDVPYRIATLVQITGALIVAAGIRPAFTDHDFDIVFLGYVVMRVGLVALWLRAALNDPPRRTTTLRYAFGLIGALFGWSLMWIAGSWPLWGWLLMAVLELLVPIWAENAGKTPWHPGHIAERYGLLTIIVLGESILAATNAVQLALHEQSPGVSLLAIISGGLLTVFSLWWLYFDRSAHNLLTSNRMAFMWGYGHYLIFAAVAAVGAGVAINVDHVSGHTQLSDVSVGATVTIPVAVVLCLLWVLLFQPHQTGPVYSALLLGSAAFVLLASFSPWPVLSTGLISALLVTISIIFSSSFDENGKPENQQY